PRLYSCVGVTHPYQILRGGPKPGACLLSRDRHEADLDRLPINGGAGFRIGGSISGAPMDLVNDAKRYLDSVFEIAHDALRRLGAAGEFYPRHECAVFEPR